MLGLLKILSFEMSRNYSRGQNCKTTFKIFDFLTHRVCSWWKVKTNGTTSTRCKQKTFFEEM